MNTTRMSETCDVCCRPKAERSSSIGVCLKWLGGSWADNEKVLAECYALGYGIERKKTEARRAKQNESCKRCGLPLQTERTATMWECDGKCNEIKKSYFELTPIIAARTWWMIDDTHGRWVVEYCVALLSDGQCRRVVVRSCDSVAEYSTGQQWVPASSVKEAKTAALAEVLR